jgi:hypothetical protein
MQQVMEIPAPNSQDSETVATALETAALFRARGDAAEALRWLQRAAESSGDEGDDARTLALARCAAELSHWVHTANNSLGFKPSSEPPPNSVRRSPKPPSRAPGQPSSPSAPPPAPSSRSHSTPVSAAPSSPSGAPTPLQRVLSRPPLGVEPAAARIARTEARAEDVSENDRVTQVGPAPRPSLPPGNADPRLRQAARVSITASAHEAGLFEVRVLDEGMSPPPDASEGFLLLVDGRSTLFSR